MTKILAISGGIDSMVMLDLLHSQNKDSNHPFPTDNYVVAHYDHGTRPSSKADADFVVQTSMIKYNLLALTGVAKLGEGVSEEVARENRYQYLHQLAINLVPPQTVKLSASKPCHPSIGVPHPAIEIYTAHHLDDLVESITINLLRGTGWRGLAVLDAPGIVRPFLDPAILGTTKPWDKKAILRYAAKHHVSFRQDPTNCEDYYLRNRVRKKLADFSEAKKQQLFHLWQRQKDLKHTIDTTVAELLPPYGEVWQRSWFRNLDEVVALELLRAGTLRAGISATRPQLRNFREAILNYAPGTYFNLPGDRLIKLNKTTFEL